MSHPDPLFDPLDRAYAEFRKEMDKALMEVENADAELFILRQQHIGFSAPSERQVKLFEGVTALDRGAEQIKKGEL